MRNVQFVDVISDKYFRNQPWVITSKYMNTFCSHYQGGFCCEFINDLFLFVCVLFLKTPCNFCLHSYNSYTRETILCMRKCIKVVVNNFIRTATELFWFFLMSKYKTHMSDCVNTGLNFSPSLLVSCWQEHSMYALNAWNGRWRKSDDVSSETNASSDILWRHHFASQRLLM